MGRKPKQTRPSTLSKKEISFDSISIIEQLKQRPNEPFYETMNNFMSLYKLSEKKDLVEQTLKLAKINDIYLNRIHELENRIQTLGNQTRLF